MVKTKANQRRGLNMKKLLSLLFVSAILLAACNSSELSITEVQKIPQKVQESIDTDYTLQLVNDSKSDVKYIIFQTVGSVTAELEEREKILDIKLDTENEENSELKQYVYKITRGDAQYDSINVKINGQDTPIDSSTGF